MSDREKELDLTLETAAATLRESERLADEAAKARDARREWEAANGIGEATRGKFYKTLSPEEQAKVREEEEAFNRELAHDIETAIQQAFPGKKAGSGGAKRPRQMA